MMNKILKSSVVVAVLAVVFIAILGWTGERRATVHSEPLPCFAQGDTLVCFDGMPQPTLNCQRLDASTVLCTP